MPDAHWLTEKAQGNTRRRHRLRIFRHSHQGRRCRRRPTRHNSGPGSRLRHASTCAKNLYDRDYVRQWTKPAASAYGYVEISKGTGGLWRAAGGSLKWTRILKEGEKEPPAEQHIQSIVPEKLRLECGDYIWWDKAGNAPKMLTRDDVGKNSKIGDALLEGTVEVTLADGKKVRCRRSSTWSGTAAHFDPKTVEELTWAPAGPQSNRWTRHLRQTAWYDALCRRQNGINFQ
ncbi:MAG: hypothetical protein IPJ07_18015 [Acidobacteria bacterium]|nr:hypothetical protein [Acidobacteriota bacterium]